jgi:endogenous inhibitor of DNA gyrase (YacG/DUF329 family)
MDTTRIDAAAFEAKSGRCPHCGASVGASEVIASTMRSSHSGTTELHKIIECAICRKQSRFVLRRA